jgi:ribosomal protein S12 methylthiotransferase
MKTKRSKNTINIVTLGCSKNLVDSEVLMRQIDANNLKVVHDSDSFEAKTVVINTCGFIKDAKEESIDTILNFIKAKEAGDIERVYVMGCLSERYKKDLAIEIPEVDQYFGSNDIQQIVKALGGDYKNELLGERLTTTPGHYAYLKISEGCDRTCSFCAIPIMRGKHRSKEMGQVVAEATHLVEKGTKELILIAQDLTYYGTDIYKANRLADLLEQMAQIKGLEWIRLHYAFPTNFPTQVLPVIREHRNICRYLDMPLQHVSNEVLKKMRRGHTNDQLKDLLHHIKQEVPGIALRTTMMVGHPGEGEKEFEELMQFVELMQFDRLGVFTYSEEEDTFSARSFKDDVPEEVKNQRLETLMEMQSGISYQKNQSKVGTVLKTLIDRREGDYYIGRTEYDSPEVDNEVLIGQDGLEIGGFYQVRITKADEFDLHGEIS